MSAKSRMKRGAQQHAEQLRQLYFRKFKVQNHVSEKDLSPGGKPFHFKGPPKGPNHKPY
jgi:hypothetical protein